MPPDERLENFGFLYNEEGPQLNPHILEKLKPEDCDDGVLDGQARLLSDPVRVSEHAPRRMELLCDRVVAFLKFGFWYSQWMQAGQRCAAILQCFAIPQGKF